MGDDSSGSDSVQCNTDLGSCCTGAQTGISLMELDCHSLEVVISIYEYRRAQRVSLHRI